MTEERRPADRPLPAERGVVPAQPELGGGAATPSLASTGETTGLPRSPGSTRIGPRTFDWGTRTYVMGILNVTPDSFSGDGLLAPTGRDSTGPDPAVSPTNVPGAPDHVAAALALARTMVDEGADLLDVGGESTRPGHAIVDADEERRRAVPVIAAVRAGFPDLPISIDTTKPLVAAAAIDAGASLVNDVWASPKTTRSLAWPPSVAFRSCSCTTGRRRAT